MLPTVGARTWLALCLGRLGRFEEGLTWAEEAATIAERDGDARESVWADFVVARIHLGRGRFAAGRPLLERAIARAENGRFPNYFPRVLSSLGVAWTYTGRAGEALSLLERAASEARTTQSAYGRAMVLTQLGDAYLDVDRLDEAGKLADEALALTGPHGERGDQAWALHLLGGILASRGERAAALRVLQETLAQAEHLGMRPLAARTHHRLGVVHLGSGDRSLGETHVARAVELYRAMGMAHWIDQAEALLTPPAGP
jgi:tetratricopeptide (TPR) repeat protein